jgi:tetratricopeptide (TPR) repeat protein
MLKRTLRLSASIAAALLAVTALAADTPLQQLPVPDTSKLAPEAAKDLAETRAEFDKVKNGLVGPPLALAYADIGAAYARAGFDDAAAIAFYDATQANPNDGRWYYLRGLMARKLKHDQDARTNFVAALEHDKVYLPIRYRLADTLTDLGDLAGARKVLENTAHDYPNKAATEAMLGRLALREKRFADAVAALNRALKLEPGANELYEHLAAAYDGMGNGTAAADARAKAGKVVPGIDDPLAVSLIAVPGQAAPTLASARGLAQQGRVGAARDQLVAVLEKKPNDVEALALLARIDATTGNVAIAQGEAADALKADDNSATAHFSAGLVAEYAGDDARAYDEYNRAQRLDKKLPDTWLMLGNAEMRRQRYGQAVEQYRQLTVLQPDSVLAQAHLTAALVAQGQCGDALQNINKALARRSRDGDLMVIYIRLASTCAAASVQERDIALDYGQVLYKQSPDTNTASAYALALAAHGKFKEAQEYQAQAIFEATRARDSATAAMHREAMQLFVKQQVPDKPWPASHPYFKTPMLTANIPAPAPAAAPAKNP